MDPSLSDVHAEVFARHGTSVQPESLQLKAILQAVTEVIQAEGMEVTPLTLFAATMSALEKPETVASAEVCLAMCSLLGIVLSRVPSSIVRSKFSGSAAVVTAVLDKHRTQAAVSKAALQCLGQVLSALDPSNWAAALAPFSLLLSFSTDPRPKVRRRAQTSLVEVLASIRGGPAAQPAGDALLRLCQRVLPGPEAAARAAATASNKQRSSAEEAITKAVSDALHLLALLKQLLPLTTSSTALATCDLLFKLYPLRQALLSRHTTEALTALVSSAAAPLPPASLAQLLQVVMDQEALWDARDADNVLSLTRLLEGGLAQLHSQDKGLCSEKVARAVHLLVPQLAAEQDGVRFGTSQALRNIITDCLDDELIAVAARGAGKPPLPGQQLPPVQSVVAAVVGALGARYEEAWHLALPVASTLLERLGSSGRALAAGLIEAIGALCAGVADLGDEAEQLTQAAAGAQHASAAEAAMGAALQYVGPDAVLSVLPLNLKEGLDGSGEARTWLLPMIKRHVKGARLDFWHRALMPVAKAMGSRAAVATRAGQRSLAATCHALELQIWAMLPAFCTWPADGAAAYRGLAKDLGAAFTAREDLRVPICMALQRLCLQQRRVLVEGGEKEMVGYAEPAGADNDDDEEDGADAEQDGGPPPATYMVEMARQVADALRAYSRNWLPLLFKTFLDTAPEARGHIGSAISAYCTISEPALLANLFRQVIMKLIKVVEDSKAELPPTDMITDGGQDPGQRRNSFTELALCMAGGLDDTGLATLVKAAKGGVTEQEAAVQKKAYKVLAYVCERRPAYLRAHFQELLELLLAGSAVSLSAARRYRLRCLKPAIVLLDSVDCPPLDALPGDDGEAAATDPLVRRRQLIAALLGEITLAIKEVNTKTRAIAYQLLADVAHAMARDDDAMEDGGERAGGLRELFNMVLGGLVGSTPHMISASVMALARLLYEFSGQLGDVVPQLLPAVLMLLRSKAREVVKSVLGFVKVVAVVLPLEQLQPFLPQILEGLLLWCEDSKNKFKLKVRSIVERLAKRCGFEAMAQAMPPSDSRLLAHIRKESNRKQRRASQAGSVADGEEEGGQEEDVRSRRSAATARTKHSAWAHSRIFSDEEGSEGRAGAGGRQQAGRAALSTRSAPVQRGQGARLADGDEPMNLLDATASRQLVRTAAGMRPRGDVAMDDFQRDVQGKLVINDDEEGRPGGKRKRRGGDDLDSDDSDLDDLRGIKDLKYAMKAAGKSVHFAASVAGAKSVAASLGGKSRASSMGGKSHMSAGGRSSASAGASKGTHHSGERFKPKKSGTGGDVKGGQKVEPYAYWSFDRKMLNRRAGKKAGASKNLATVVRAAKAGAARGAKAKRQRVD